MVGKTNVYADRLSMGKLDQFWEEVKKNNKQMNEDPEQLPLEYCQPTAVTYTYLQSQN